MSDYEKHSSDEENDSSSDDEQNKEEGEGIEQYDDEYKEQIEYQAQRISKEDSNWREKIHWGSNVSINKRDSLRTYIQGDNKLAKLQRLLRDEDITDSVFFDILLGNAADEAKIDESDVDKVRKLIPLIQGIRYKNPPAMLFALLALDKIQKDPSNTQNILEDIIKTYSSEKTNKMTIYDLIRYTEYIKTLKSSKDYLSVYKQE